MRSQQQLAQVIDEILETEEEKDIDSSTVEDYKKLNEKCDVVIGKIKNRKGKKITSNKQMGD